MEYDEQGNGIFVGLHDKSNKLSIYHFREMGEWYWKEMDEKNTYEVFTKRMIKENIEESFIVMKLERFHEWMNGKMEAKSTYWNSS